jgi:nickel/cobalt transporter (NicO) family protein
VPDFLLALQNGASNLWIFIPTAILLGALHGLEPGHSKTMMASFIIAIRGTLSQAILLGLAAAFSHSLIIWLLAAGALQFGSKLNVENVEPYIQIGSAIIVVGLAAWMFFRTRRNLRDAKNHNLNHSHSEFFTVNTGHGNLELSVFEEGVPPVFQIRAAKGSLLPETAEIETVRPDGNRQSFSFVLKGDFLESTTAIPEPHEFNAVLKFIQNGHAHTRIIEFQENNQHHHHGPSKEFQDSHERAHAQDIAKRFAGQTVTTPQIILFGITGGLMPCPAAFTVLLVCLQLKKVALGFTMVGAFSVGLAVSMVAAGAVASLSVKEAQKRFKGFTEIMRRAPYFSCILLLIIAAYMAWNGVHHLLVA